MLNLIADTDHSPAEIAASIGKTGDHLKAVNAVQGLRAERDASHEALRATAARFRDDDRSDSASMAEVARLDAKTKTIEGKLKAARAELAHHEAERGRRVEQALTRRRRDAAGRIAQALESIRQNLAQAEDIHDAVVRAGGSMPPAPQFWNMAEISAFVRRYGSDK